MRFTAKMYDKAIENLNAAKKQLEPDGNCCEVCGDSGHMAFECGFNPLVAMEICKQVTASADKLHDVLHWLSGHYSAFGEQLGPAKVVTPEDQIEAEAKYRITD